MAPVRGHALLDRVIARIHAGQTYVASSTDYQLGAIALRLLSQLKHDGVTSLDLACIACFGMRFDKWRTRNMERQSQLAWEFSQLITDYDPALDKTTQTRRPQPFSGNLYEMSEQKKPTQQESVRRVPRNTKAAKQGTAS